MDLLLDVDDVVVVVFIKVDLDFVMCFVYGPFTWAAW